MVSIVLHLAMLLVVSVLILPFHLGESGSINVEASLELQDMPLETFTMTAGIQGIDLASSEEPVTPEVFDATPVRLPGLLAGGDSGDGPGGWNRGSAGKRGGAGGASGPRAEYFGTVAHGDRFVYILDISSSMNRGGKRRGAASGPPQPGSRFDRACYELVRSIEQLTEDQFFYVILFCYQTRRMFDDQSLAPQLIRASHENKANLRKWLRDVRLGGGTDPRDAIHLALKMTPDAVFILSDGEFNGHKSGNRTVMLAGNPKVTEVVQRTNSSNAPIHAFAYEDPQSKKRMRELAETTGGQYRYIPPLKKTRTVLVRPPSGASPPMEKRADTLLRAAGLLQSNGKKKEAIERYRKIVDEFPGTDAAVEAGRQIAQFSMK
jgi:hypothetical protein